MMSLYTGGWRRKKKPHLHLDVKSITDTDVHADMKHQIAGTLPCVKVQPVVILNPMPAGQAMADDDYLHEPPSP